jgi:hypothetical protein
VCPSFHNLIEKWVIALDTCLVMLRCLSPNYCICQNVYDQTIHCQLWTPPKHEKEDEKSTSVDLSMFDIKNDKSSSVNLKIFDIDDSKSSDLDDCCHHIEKVGTII